MHCDFLNVFKLLVLSEAQNIPFTHITYHVLFGLSTLSHRRNRADFVDSPSAVTKGLFEGYVIAIVNIM